VDERQTSESPVNIRIKGEQRNIIDQARKIVGKNRSEFMLEASLYRAKDILLEQSFFHVNKLDFDKFCDILDNPPAPSGNLRRLLHKKSPWQE
jgi:uncharacterized protein (DUF1778 family)